MRSPLRPRRTGSCWAIRPSRSRSYVECRRRDGSAVVEGGEAVEIGDLAEQEEDLSIAEYGGGRRCDEDVLRPFPIARLDDHERRKCGRRNNLPHPLWVLEAPHPHAGHGR